MFTNLFKHTVAAFIIQQFILFLIFACCMCVYTKSNIGIVNLFLLYIQSL